MNRTERNKIAVNHLPIVGLVVNEFCHRNIGADRDELTSVGFAALLEASEKYDPAKPFGAYLRTILRGRMVDFLREQNHVSRHARDQAADAARTEESMTSSLGRSVSNAEVAEAMGVSERTLAKRRALARPALPIESAEVLAADPEHDPEHVLLAKERGRAIVSMISALPGGLREVVEQIYVHGSSVGEVAESLGISHAAVSQRRSEAVNLLRQIMLDTDAESGAEVPSRPVSSRKLGVMREAMGLGASTNLMATA